MSDDLVKRLRSPEVFLMTSGMISPIAEAAADRIEKLEADLEIATMKRLLDSNRIEKLEAALREIDIACDYSGSEYVCRGIARKALDAK